MAHAATKDRDAMQERDRQQDEQYSTKLHELEAMYRKQNQRNTHPATAKQLPNTPSAA